MNEQKPERLFRRNLKLSPYYGLAGGLLAIILGFWTPLYISFLILAAVTGSIVFFIEWFGVRRRVYLGPVCTVLSTFILLIGHDLLLPRDVRHGVSFRCGLQFVGVWIFALAAFHFGFREKLKRDLEAHDA